MMETMSKRNYVIGMRELIGGDRGLRRWRGIDKGFERKGKWRKSSLKKRSNCNTRVALSGSPCGSRGGIVLDKPFLRAFTCSKRVQALLLVLSCWNGEPDLPPDSTGGACARCRESWYFLFRSSYPDTRF